MRMEEPDFESLLSEFDLRDMAGFTRNFVEVSIEKHILFQLSVILKVGNFSNILFQVSAMPGKCHDS